MPDRGYQDRSKVFDSMYWSCFVDLCSKHKPHQYYRKKAKQSHCKLCVKSKARLEEIRNSAPAKSAEVKRFLTEFNASIKPSGTPGTSRASPTGNISSNLKGSKLNVSLTIGDIIDLPRRFRTYKSSTGHLLLDMMPLPTCLNYVEQIVNLLVGCPNSDEAAVHRMVGPVGVGKSHAALLILLSSLVLYRSMVVFVTLDPLQLITNPTKIVEQLVLQLCQVGIPKVVESLFEIYIQAKMADNPEHCLEASLEALVVCRKLCSDNGVMFIHILDDENVLHQESKCDTMQKLIKHMLCKWGKNMKILIASPPLQKDPYVRNYADVQLHLISHVSDPVAATTSCMYNTFLESSYFCDTRKNNLIAWERHMGSKSQMITAIEEYSHGTSLETFLILDFLGNVSVSDSPDPWSDFMESSPAFYEDHRSIMSEQFNTRYDSSRMLAHACILATLDFHNEASEEELEKAGVWLWSKFRPYPEKSPMKWISKFYDGRVMSMDVNQTPRSLSSRGARALRSLPKRFYLDYYTVLDLHSEAAKMDNTMAKLKRQLTVYSRFLSDDVVLSLVLHVAANQLLRDGIKLNSWECFQHPDWFRILSPWSNMLCEQGFDDCINVCFTEERRDRHRWTMLVPGVASSELMDFALLYFPQNNEPPILFPVMVNYSLCDRQPYDKIFRTGTSRDYDSLVHPLLDLFNTMTKGKGRVQYIWIVKESQDFSELIADGKFDSDTWFTTMDQWKKIYDSRFDTEKHPRFAPPFRDIGYSSKSAVNSARKNFAKRRRIRQDSEQG